MSNSSITGARTKRAPIGAGTPTKKCFGRISLIIAVLNLANRIAIHELYSSTAPQDKSLYLNVCKDHKYITIAGATPKFTKSAKESSSAPKVLVALSMRAILPSNPSKIAATIIAVTASSHLPSIAKRIELNPTARANNVITLGNNLMNKKDALDFVDKIFSFLKCSYDRKYTKNYKNKSRKITSLMI